MKYYIFTTEQEALQYDIDVCAMHNFSAGTNFANPIKHPTRNEWAISESPRVQIIDENEDITAVELTNDWFNDSI